MKPAKAEPHVEYQPDNPKHRLTSTRRVSPVEAARQQKLRAAVLEEFPPAPGSKAAVLLSLQALRPHLRQLREAAGLSLADLAEQTGMDKAALSRLENGHVANPGIETIVRYLHALGKDIECRFIDRAGQQQRGRRKAP
jgi:DNA-binding XRE family transcriptional regulator